MTYPPFKTYYQYDSNGAYTGPCEAQLSPLDAPGTYLAPTLSTDVAPPSYAVNQIPVFAGAWTIDADYRGATWYDQTTGAAVEITAIGQPASNLAATPPPPTLAQAQASQIGILFAAYMGAIQQSVSYTSIAGVAEIYQCNTLAISNVQNSLLGYSGILTTPVGFYWVAADNVQVPFTYADLQGLASAMMAQGWAMFQKLQTLKAEVLAASTVSTVTSIVW